MPDRGGRSAATRVVIRELTFRSPFDGRALLDFLAVRAVPGVEEVAGGVHRRSLRLPYGDGTVELAPARDHVCARFWLADAGDLDAAVASCRALLGLDADPAAVLAALGEDPIVGALVRAAPGRRVPGTTDGHELAIRAVLGQQVSLGGARTLAARLVRIHGRPLTHPVGGVTHAFPTAAALARTDPTTLAMPAARRRALVSLAGALARDEVTLEPGADVATVEHRLRALPGIGPWTAAYVAMRALRDPDAFLPTDLGVRHALTRLGHDSRPAGALRVAEAWRPHRAAAVVHLWASLAVAPGARASGPPGGRC